MKNIFIFLFFLFIFSVANADSELGGGQNNPQESAQNFPEGHERRSNYNQCSASEKEQRLEKFRTCNERFGELGLEESVSPSEIIEPGSCPSIERNTEFLSGLANCIKSQFDTIEAIGRLFGIGRYDEQVLQACGRADYRVDEFSTNEDVAKLRTYSACKNRTIDAIKARETATRERVNTQIAGYRSRCQQDNPNLVWRGRARSGTTPGLTRALNSCMIRLAGEEGCRECIQEISGVDIGGYIRTIATQVYNDLNSYRGFQCFNKATQGEMVCQAILVGAGGAWGAYKSFGAVAGAVRNRAAGTAREALNRAEAGSSESIARAGRAASGASDTAASRAALGEEVLRKEGLLAPGQNLTEAQSQALFRAHQVPEQGSNWVQQKARILQEGGFNQQQRRALMQGRDELDGRGVAGGYNYGSVTRFDNSFEANRGRPDYARLEAETLESQNGGQITDAGTALRREEVSILERHAQSGGTTAPGRQVDLEDVSRANSDYAGYVRSSNPTEYESSISKAVEYRKQFVESDAYKSEVRSRGYNPSDTKDLASYNLDLYQNLRNSLGSVRNSQAAQERIRAEMEVLKRYAADSGWRMDHYN